MKILHTSDWHLGRTLYSKKERLEEHQAFLTWLLQTIQDYQIEVLLIAGDIFDTATPNHASQKLYYDFLIKVKQFGCKHVVVIGGNHDSPSFLNAPKDILSALEVQVIGHAEENLEKEILVIHNQQNQPTFIICGVPFLRERDISKFSEGESYSERSIRINQNIKKHYEQIALLAEAKRKEIGKDLPIIATGHLSVAGGKRNEDDGVRDTYIGNIEAVGSDIFPDTFDYVALGHYHIPSSLKEHIRYCGSPIPMGFGEAKQQKCVYVLSFKPERVIETVAIPCFQRLETIQGDKETIAAALKELVSLNISVWVEVVYQGKEIFPELSTSVNHLVANSLVEVLKIQNKQFLKSSLQNNSEDLTLETLNVYDVFDKLLEGGEIDETQQKVLKESYKEIVTQISLGEGESEGEREV
jgi:exonuclease SbcD